METKQNEHQLFNNDLAAVLILHKNQIFTKTIGKYKWKYQFYF